MQSTVANCFINLRQSAVVCGAQPTVALFSGRVRELVGWNPKCPGLVAHYYYRHTKLGKQEERPRARWSTYTAHWLVITMQYQANCLTCGQLTGSLDCSAQVLVVVWLTEATYLEKPSSRQTSMWCLVKFMLEFADCDDRDENGDTMHWIKTISNCQVYTAVDSRVTDEYQGRLLRHHCMKTRH